MAKRHYLVRPYPGFSVFLQEFHEATLSLREMNFPGKEQGRRGGAGEGEEGRKADTMTTTRRIEIRNFYMCPDRIDFRICRQYLPSAAPAPFQCAWHSLIFPTTKFRGSTPRKE